MSGTHEDDLLSTESSGHNSAGAANDNMSTYKIETSVVEEDLTAKQFSPFLRNLDIYVGGLSEEDLLLLELFGCETILVFHGCNSKEDFLQGIEGSIKKIDRASVLSRVCKTFKLKDLSQFEIPLATQWSLGGCFDKMREVTTEQFKRVLYVIHWLNRPLK